MGGQMAQNIEAFEEILKEKAKTLYPSSDPSHDYLHILRVVAMAKKSAEDEGAEWWVVMPAAYLHDCVNVPKNDPRRKEASTLSADAAIEYLRSIDYPAAYYEAIHHAIRAHSFSANIPCETLEAKIIQDADRLDGLGAIGMARMFTVAGLLGRPYYDADDFWADARTLDDQRFTIDHCAVKLLLLAEKLNTKAAQAEGARRTAFISHYLEELNQDVNGAV
jgi:uncharacterized protein